MLYHMGHCGPTGLMQSVSLASVTKRLVIATTFHEFFQIVLVWVDSGCADRAEWACGGGKPRLVGFRGNRVQDYQSGVFGFRVESFLANEKAQQVGGGHVAYLC